MKTTLSGRWGEAVSADFLRRHGYEILAVNYRSRWFEVDIIAKKGNVTAFVEVKLRHDDKFSSAREAVDAKKRKRIIDAAKMWQSENGDEDQIRFDVMEVYAKEPLDEKTAEINHIKNAFFIE